MEQVEMPTVGLFAEIKGLYALRGAAEIVLGEYAGDVLLSSAWSTNSNTRKQVGA